MPYTLIIKERNNSWAGRPPARSVHETLEAAMDALADYVARNWDAELGLDRPENLDEMVKVYFTEVPEAYEIVSG